MENDVAYIIGEIFGIGIAVVFFGIILGSGILVLNKLWQILLKPRKK